MKSPLLLLLLCVSVPSFMINLDANIVAVSLTAIAHAFHADFADTEWVISAYTLSFAALLMPAGTLADRFGRKRMLLLGLALFTLASAVCGFAGSIATLNLARAAQGAGAALQLSAALAVLSHAFQGPARGRAFAFWGSVIGVAVMLGPVAGGLLTGLLNWRWAFYINLPIGVLMIGLTLANVTESRNPASERIDWLGVITFSGFLGTLTYALICGNRVGWHDPQIAIELGIAAVLLALFILAESRQAHPMMDLRYYALPTYLGANIASLSFAAAFLTMLTYFPLYFQTALSRSPLQAGFMMLPLALPLFVVPRLVSRHLDARWSGRDLLTLGFALLALGMFGAALSATSLSYGTLGPCVFVASIGAGVLNGQVAKVGMSVIPPERAGMASGIGGTMRFSGIVIGFAALGALLPAAVGSHLAQAIPALPAGRIDALVHAAISGRFSSAAALPGPETVPADQLREALAQGYRSVMLAAAMLAAAAGASSWLLVRARDTAPAAPVPVPPGADSGA